ncbi:hypothetical protein HLB44_05580 [Aquincola sp. S2]|uniref:Uncharacterized protein n=1 Tax=Pseudaquabacterium terrae TaxID=2732868 RepID=A0ABX2ED42_9BURK|nr:hypothetical protein [Aquabacterium terrae]NRF66447.1 hypothetical protein [Aquabacterium terrae]
MAGDHDRGKREGQFCAVPANPKCDDCPGSKTYIEVCKPTDWFGHTFKRLVKAKAGAFTFDKKYEAHHILCVAPVSEHLVALPAIEKVIRQTKWCINNADNMIAMPLWGHTVKWYCTITAAGGSAAAGVDAPPFANIPQHDYDHNCKEGYTYEIEVECKKLADAIEESGHALKGEKLEGKLNKLSGQFRTELSTRGNRKEGTHNAWALGGKEPPDPQWCHPFSMASDSKVSTKGFPARNFNEAVAKWIKRIATAISHGA